MATQQPEPRRVRLSHAIALTAALVVAGSGPVRSQSRPAPPAGGTTAVPPSASSVVPPSADGAYRYDPAVGATRS